MKKLKMVVGFMFNRKETDVLLIEKKKPVWQEGLLNGIGGKVKNGESFLAAMIREFKEECGIFFEEWRYIITMSGDDWEVQVFTSKTDDVFYFKSMEEERVHLIRIDELDEYMHVSNLQWLIPMCLDSNGGKGIDYVLSNDERSVATEDAQTHEAGNQQTQQ